MNIYTNINKLRALLRGSIFLVIKKNIRDILNIHNYQETKRKTHSS